jgi:hypothetical protein
MPGKKGMSRKGIEAYRDLVARLVDFQRRLIPSFEAQVEIAPLSKGFAFVRGSGRQDTERPLSQWLRDLPPETKSIPLAALVKPRRGIFDLELKHWLFQIHGSIQVSFLSLPSSLDAQTLKELEVGKSEALVGYVGESVCVDVQYLQDARIDGVSAWSVFTFAASTDSYARHLSYGEHQQHLEALVLEGFLCRWPTLVAADDKYYVPVS